MALIPAALTGARHPLDPDPVRSTKAAAVLALGIVAALTGFFLGGLVPATLALLLARQARAEQVAAAGFLTGGPALRVGGPPGRGRLRPAAPAPGPPAVLRVPPYRRSPHRRGPGPH